MKTDRRAFLAGAVGLAAGRAALGQDTSEGPDLLKFDFPRLHIGAATYPQGPTGCTVFHFPRGAQAVVDVRGGAPATYFTDQLRDTPGHVDAICLAGGSLYGLEAAAGVAAELFERRNRSTAWNRIAAVTGAILHDFPPRRNALYPDKKLGRAALRAAKPGVFPLGGRGAGASATCGKWLKDTTQPELAGQGGAFHRSGPTRVAVFSVVNAVGAIHDRSGRVVRGHLVAKTGRRRPVPDLRRGGNTTLTVVVTNQRLGGRDLRQLARQVHGSMARGIRPFHTKSDGDVLYAATTAEVTNPKLNYYQLAAIAEECAWDAVLASFTGR